MKKIGISYTRTNFKYYWDWFTPDELGDEFELVKLSFLENNVNDIYGCDGFLLTGGVDVDPSFYNGEAEYENRPGEFEPERDRFEEKIYRYARQKRLPVLGICRGMQLVNVLEGGKLIQDLQAHGNSRHKKEEETDKIHEVRAERDSLLFDITTAAEGHVNSAHHQAIDPSALGKNLKVNAREDDDASIIEGIEFDYKEGKGFMLCVQWHPERMRDKEKNPFSQKLKERFLGEVRKISMKKRAIINPATGAVITSISDDNLESLEQKLAQLQQGQKAWSNLSLAERVTILQRFSEMLAAHIESLAATLSAEMGKPLQQSRNEINGGRARIKWLTENASTYLGDEIMRIENELEERIAYEPLGVICNISAWNYPYLVGINVFVPALLAGNAVLYKPSEYAILTGLEIDALLKEAGVPENVFQVATGAREVGEILLDLPFDGYFFTGSYATGKHIYERVAAKMIPCQCEMGGKDPLYVADDIADIGATAVATADGAFYNNGQSCCAVERIYVHEKVYDKYIEEFIKEVRSWKLGSPDEAGVYIGPVSRKEQLQVLEAQVQDALDKGATLAVGGKRVEGTGYYFEPTVLLEVTHEMRVMKDESFGPIIGIMKVQNDEEAIRLMQDTEYGLTAAVYSSNRGRAESILKSINAGTGYWNCCDRVSAALPWSGRKHSGFGVTLSHSGLRAFSKPKAYHLRKG